MLTSYVGGGNYPQDKMWVWISTQGHPFIFQPVTVLWYRCGSKLSECCRTPLVSPWPSTKGPAERACTYIVAISSETSQWNSSINLDSPFTTNKRWEESAMIFHWFCSAIWRPIKLIVVTETAATAHFPLVDFLCVTVTFLKSVLCRWRMPHSIESASDFSLFVNLLAHRQLSNL